MALKLLRIAAAIVLLVGMGWAFATVFGWRPASESLTSVIVLAIGAAIFTITDEWIESRERRALRCRMGER